MTDEKDADFLSVIGYKNRVICEYQQKDGQKFYRVKDKPEDDHALHHGSFVNDVACKMWIDQQEEKNEDQKSHVMSEQKVDNSELLALKAENKKLRAALNKQGSYPFTYPSLTTKFLLDVMEENQRARKKFPGGERLLGAAVEEFGEMAEALLKIKESNESPENVYKEAVQTASTVMRLAVEGEPDYSYKGMKCAYAGCQQVTTGGPCVLCYE